MSSKANSSSSGMFTSEGLPLDVAIFGAAAPTAAVADADGPARRIDCRPPVLVSAPSIRPPAVSKRAPDAQPLRPRSLSAASLSRGSLIDDDDDEIVDYFSCAAAGPRQTSAAPVRASDGAPSSPWGVRELDVPALPSFYPLERSAVFVPRASAPALACRVASVLRARSIAASYDAKNAKVDCVSKGHVEFRIRLYRGRGEYSHGIIVEVQRRSGFDLTYTQDVYAILDAAEGKAAKDLVDVTPLYYEDADCGCSSDEEDMDSLENTAGMTSLRVISDILCPQDGKLLTVEGRDFALASLASLTSLDRMGRSAVPLSNELIQSEAYADLRDAVLSHVGPSAPQRPMLQSLEILSNVANSARDPSPIVQLLSRDDHEILTKIISNIENARANPRAADLSCAILKSSCGSRASLGDAMPPRLAERLSSALAMALSFGGEFHAELERHSRQCLGLIQQ